LPCSRQSRAGAGHAALMRFRFHIRAFSIPADRVLENAAARF